MKNTLISILFVFIFNLSSAQKLKKEFQNVVITFVDCIKNKNTEKLITLISFPLKREYPLAEIKDENEFIKRYDEIFDHSLTNEISKSNLNKDWSAVGWRGLMLKNGILWLDYEGKLIAVNYQSDIERIKRIKLIETDRKSIHKSLMKFKKPISILETKKFRIRIDQLVILGHSERRAYFNERDRNYLIIFIFSNEHMVGEVYNKLDLIV